MLLNIEKYRILISRIVAVFVLFFILTTKSQWEINNEMYPIHPLHMGSQKLRCELEKKTLTRTVASLFQLSDQITPAY